MKLFPPKGARSVSFGNKTYHPVNGLIEVADDYAPALIDHGCVQATDEQIAEAEAKAPQRQRAAPPAPANTAA